MGIVAFCPNGHRLKLKDELAGRKGVCPTCHARFRVPQPQAVRVERPAAPAARPTARVASLDPHVITMLPAAIALPAGRAADVAEPGVDAGEADGDVAPEAAGPRP